MALLPVNLTWERAQTLWKATLDPLLKTAISNGNLLQGIALQSGDTTFNHGLGRTPIGWFIVDVTAAATIYRSANFNPTTLTLSSSAPTTVSVWIF